MRRRNVAYIRTPDLARLQDTQASQQVGLTGLANINICYPMFIVWLIMLEIG